MRILVHEHVSSGALVNAPASLLREGRAMRSALVMDLKAAGHEVVTADPIRAARSVDAVWLIAPEAGRVHQRIARQLESAGATLVGSTNAAIRCASDKRALAWLLKRHHIPHPRTRLIREDKDAAFMAATMGYAVVVKPAHGAGCRGVTVASNARALTGAIAEARAAAGTGSLLMQEYVEGVPASVSLLADGRRAVPLTLNLQRLSRRTHRIVYDGGGTPLEHPLARRALDTAVRVCELIPGLRGFVGVDVVLTGTDAVVIEINPRLTTAYLGVRAALGFNVADKALAACRGELPGRIPLRRRVTFDASGAVQCG